jgi:hypothetical protein
VDDKKEFIVTIVLDIICLGLLLSATSLLWRYFDDNLRYWFIIPGWVIFLAGFSLIVYKDRKWISIIQKSLDGKSKRNK